VTLTPRSGGRDGRVAGPARDIQHVLACANADAADETRADLVEPLLAHHRVVVTCRPRGLGSLPELRQAAQPIPSSASGAGARASACWKRARASSHRPPDSAAQPAALESCGGKNSDIGKL
jgi:hypothetical protein